MSAQECKDCGHVIAQQQEKAIGSGEYAIVWGDLEGDWVCPVTGDEHVPGHPTRPVQVIVKHGTSESMIRLSLAEAANFVFDPVNGALDDGDASWDLQGNNPERFASLTKWAEGLYGVTSE